MTFKFKSITINTIKILVPQLQKPHFKCSIGTCGQWHYRQSWFTHCLISFQRIYGLLNDLMHFKNGCPVTTLFHRNVFRRASESILRTINFWEMLLLMHPQCARFCFKCYIYGCVFTCSILTMIIPILNKETEAKRGLLHVPELANGRATTQTYAVSMSNIITS